jgi:hypothetical protein
VLPRPRIRRLGIGQVHSPGDFRFGVGDFIDRSVVVVREDTELCGLTLNPALRVFEAAGRIWRLADPFRTDEELVWAVADTCDADRRVNFVHGCPVLPPRTKSATAEPLCDPASRRLQPFVSLPFTEGHPPRLIPAARTGTQPSPGPGTLSR